MEHWTLVNRDYPLTLEMEYYTSNYSNVYDYVKIQYAMPFKFTVDILWFNDILLTIEI